MIRLISDRVQGHCQLKRHVSKIMTFLTVRFPGVGNRGTGEQSRVALISRHFFLILG
mgnify:CR=1